MKHLSFSFQTTVSFSEPVSDHSFVLRCVPATNDAQVAPHCTVDLAPRTSYALQRDPFSNTLVVGCIEEPHDSFTYGTSGKATVDFSRRVTRPAHPMYRFPSPLAKMSEELDEFLGSCNLRFGTSPRTACELLMHAVHDAMAYEPGTTNVRTTAAEAFAQRSGVCQDYAHILIALLRACGIPARYATGLTIGEGATHAWVQAHLDGLWVGLDPTRDVLVDEGYLVMSRGRDWSDCPIERGVFQGAVDQTQTVSMRVEEVDA